MLHSPHAISAMRNATRSFLLLSFLFFAPQPGTAQDGRGADDEHWSTQFGNPSIGNVQGVAVDGDDAFLTGRFRLDSLDEEPQVLRWNGETGQFEAIGRSPVLPGESQGFGPVLATPDTVFVGIYSETRLAAWDRKTKTWTAMDEGLDHTVAGLARGDQGQLYALTRYIIDQTAPWYGQVYRWNGDSWSALGESFEGYPTAIAAGDAEVFISLKSETASTSHEVRRWTGSGWRSVGNVAGEVGTMEVNEQGVLYVGGRFDAIGGVTIRNVARWDGREWTALGDGIDNQSDRASGIVYDLTTSEGRVYAAGRINDAGGQPVGNVAMWDGSSWSRMRGGVDGNIQHVAHGSGTLYAAGSFVAAGDTATHNVALWEESEREWKPLYESRGQGVRGPVRAVTTHDSGTFVAGGEFSAAGDVRARNVALWNGEKWSALGEGVPGDVRALLDGESKIYAGGEFSSEDDALSYGLAIWAGENWEYLGAGDQGRRLEEATSIARANSRLYVAGTLRKTNTQTTTGVFAWDGQKWSVLGEVYGENDFAAASVVEAADGQVYLGGDFDGVSGMDARNVARWNGSSWEALSEGVSREITALEVKGGKVYAGGQVSDSLHVWNRDSETWSSLESAIKPPEDCTVRIQVIEAHRSDLYVGAGAGVCLTDEREGSAGTQMLARWDGDKWMTFENGIRGGGIGDLALQGDDLYAGGYFREAGGHSSLNVAHWEDVTVLDAPPPRDGGEDYRLYSNYPNPFTSRTVFRFALPERAHVSLAVYDVLGREVRRLADRRMEAGTHRIAFEASDLPSGVYVYRLQAGSFSKARRMVVVR